jgi:hypothetical protein
MCYLGCNPIRETASACQLFRSESQRGSTADGPADGAPPAQPVTTVTCVEPSDLQGQVNLGRSAISSIERCRAFLGTELSWDQATGLQPCQGLQRTLV